MLEKFTVIDLVRTRSDAVVTITGNAVKFNNQTAVELHHPSHIQFLILQKEKQFAIRVCKPDAPNAAKFCKGEGQKGQIRITAPSVVDLLRKMGGWGEDESWNIPGIYFAEDNGLMFDLKTAYKPAARGGWAARRQKEAAAAAALEAQDTED